MLKILQQNTDVLAGGDTAEQNNFAFRAQFFCKPLRIPRERFPVTRIAFMDIDFGKFAQIAQTYSGRGINQSTRRRNYEDAANSLGRAGEGIGVGEFATKIKSAEKGEHFTQSRAFVAAQSPGQIELCALAQNHARALAAGVGGRKQKDAIGFNLFHAGYLQKRCVRAGSQPIGRGAPRLALSMRPPHIFNGGATLCGAASEGKPIGSRLPVDSIGPCWLRRRVQNPKFTV